MAHVAGTILLHCGSPQNCFKLFCNLIQFEMIYQFWTCNIVEVQKYYRVLWKLIQDNCPKIFANMLNSHEEALSAQIFFFGWVVTLFSNVFDISLIAFLWD